MKIKPVQEKHFKILVWVNPTTESLRPEECLCLNCGKLKPDSEKNCSIAKLLHKVCVKNNIALAVTHCIEWPPRTRKKLTMKVRPTRKIYDSKKVWVNTTTESLRPSECLCYNCARLQDLDSKNQENCFDARIFLELNTKYGVALIVTRCPNWMSKN